MPVEVLQDDMSTVETFDGQTIRRSVNPDSGRYYVHIQSPQARTRSRLSGTCYAWKTEVEREDWIAGWKRQRQIKIAARQAVKEQKAAARAAFVNPYKVGDILHSSWGYDQTNVEFFQVIGVRPRALKIAQISSHLVETGFMSGNVTANPDAFIEPPRWVTIQISIWNGQTHHHVPSPIHGNLYATEPGQSLGCSWYA